MAITTIKKKKKIELNLNIKPLKLRVFWCVNTQVNKYKVRKEKGTKIKEIEKNLNQKRN